MKNFTSINEVEDVGLLIEQAEELKKAGLIHHEFGKGKTIALLFFNPSLRTRLSMQKAAVNLGLTPICLNLNSDGWQIEFEDGVIMNGDKAEHIKDAVSIISLNCDLMAVRTFATLENRESDYADKVLNAFVKYSTVPVISLESATAHPLQAYADMLTIEEKKKTQKPKIVLSWTPHVKPLPQAVPNSFVQWAKALGHNIVITHPTKMELSPTITSGVEIEYDQNKALEQADFVYAKNWSSFVDYGMLKSEANDWMIDADKMALTNDAYFMHCLPIRRNVVATDDVIDHPNSLIHQMAYNRIISAQVVLKNLLL